MPRFTLFARLKIPVLDWFVELFLLLSATVFVNGLFEEIRDVDFDKNGLSYDIVLTNGLFEID